MISQELSYRNLFADFDGSLPPSKFEMQNVANQLFNLLKLSKQERAGDERISSRDGWLRSLKSRKCKTQH